MNCPQNVYPPLPFSLPPMLQSGGIFPPYFNDSSSLLIRHLPDDYSYENVLSLLRHFRVQTLKYFGATGRLKNIAIANFDSPATAVFAMQKLHQTRLRKRRLVVEFADSMTKKHYPCHLAVKRGTEQSGSDDRDRDVIVGGDNQKSEMCYNYPAASRAILTNIMDTLTENRQLYVQVLHLMNKMDLPVPFGRARQTVSVTAPALPVDSEPVPMDLSSGSEVESEIEDTSDLPSTSVKRPALKKTPKNPKKKFKLSASIDSGQPQHSLPLDVQTVFDQGCLRERNPIHIETPSLPVTIPSNSVSESGSDLVFGKIGPVLQAPSVVVVEEGFLREADLLANRLSQDEMAVSPVFRNYQAGAPSAKLYVKNLAKPVDEEDLKHVFGRYVNWQSNRECSGFSIRLMTSGRMKGQAFITMPSQSKAEVALREVNGYILQGKPLVVTYARSQESR